MKIVIVGGVAAGASAAARLRRLDEHAEIIVFEQGAHVSFSNCSLPYHLSGVVADSDSLVMMTPGKLPHPSCGRCTDQHPGDQHRPWAEDRPCPQPDQRRGI